MTASLPATAASHATIAGFEFHYGIAVDSRGFVYVPEMWRHQIIRLSPDLQQQHVLVDFKGGWQLPQTTPPRLCKSPRIPRHWPGIYKPHAVTFAADDTMLVTEYGAGRVSRFDSDGGFRDFIGEGRLNGPATSSVLADGTIVVAEHTDSVVARFAPDGNFVGVIGAPRGEKIGCGINHASATPGGFDGPHAVLETPSGEIVVVDTNNHRLQLFEPDGACRALLGAGTDGWQSTVAPTAGVKQGAETTIGGQSTAIGGFRFPVAISQDRRGALYVADCFNHRIARFDINGRAQGFLGLCAPSDKIAASMCAAVDPGVFPWRQHGRPVAGDETGSFRRPYDLCVVGDLLYVADTHNGRVQGFDLGG